MDFHTHNLSAPAGRAIINVPKEWLLHPEVATFRCGALYSVGVHPWWTRDVAETECMLQNLPTLLENPHIIALGECGLDSLRGAPIERQITIFRQHAQWAETYALPLTLHAVRTFSLLLQLKKELRPTMPWTIHGFKGKPALAAQLLQAGFNLSFGRKYNNGSWDVVPPSRRHRETDEDG